MNLADRHRITGNYQRLFLEHREGPAVGQWSAEGQRFRFERLTAIGDLSGKSVLDLGCGIGDLYPFLRERFGELSYTGIDMVPELVSHAAQKYPSACFRCADLSTEPIKGRFDYVLGSGLFNNALEGEDTANLYSVIRAAFDVCDRALGFNFTSKLGSRQDPGMAYHDPLEIFQFCLDRLSSKVTMCHHYERRDVAVFVYRQ